jgi:hypothetical protein
MKISVDADACPDAIKDIWCRAAERERVHEGQHSRIAVDAELSDELHGSGVTTAGADRAQPTRPSGIDVLLTAPAATAEYPRECPLPSYANNPA